MPIIPSTYLDEATEGALSTAYGLSSGQALAGAGGATSDGANAPETLPAGALRKNRNEWNDGRHFEFSTRIRVFKKTNMNKGIKP